MLKVARVAVLAALIAAPAARAADDDPATIVSELVVASKVTEVSGLVVTAKPKAVPLSEVEVVATVRCLSPRRPADETVPAPRLMSSYPADGQTVQPGYAVLRLTFDLPMACRGSIGTALMSACVSKALESDIGVDRNPTQVWRQTFDRRTLLILCKLKPKTRYEMRFNQDVWQHFQAVSGREPNPGVFAFETSDAPPVLTVAGLVARDPQLATVVKREQGQ